MSKSEGSIAQAKSLIEEVTNLTSFEQVLDWDKRAKSAVEQLSVAKVERDEEFQIALSKHASEMEGRQRLPLLKRLFSSTSGLKNLMSHATRLKESASQMQRLSQSLVEWIELTPDDIGEAKQMLAELKQAKKELSAQKKGVRMEVRNVAANARVKNAEISNQIFSNSKLRRYQRIDVRASKERSLSPLEAQIAELDAQILSYDRLINWIERMKLG